MMVWQIAEEDLAATRVLVEALGVSTTLARLLVNRGHANPARAQRFLNPRMADLRRPDGEHEMSGFAVAVQRLVRAIETGEVIGLFGDYDVDGVTSAALLARVLRRSGGTVVMRVAEREAGYGLSPDTVRTLHGEGARVLVTCDCGTSDHDAIATAVELGVDVIVVDHHQVPDLSAGEPGWLALINPHQPRCHFPFKGLASVGVAFYLAAALRTALVARGRTAADPREELDLVAIGTICDLAPLTDENRILVHAGLQRLRTSPRPGLAALGVVAGFDLSTLRATDVGMRIGPRLNAPGRLGSASLALELLLAPDAKEAHRLAAAIEEVNTRRREITQRVSDEARLHPGAQPGRAATVVDGDGWSHGVVGIVAARLVEETGRPCIVIGFDGDVGRGSARTVPGINLYESLKEVAHLLTRFGGHAQAAGLTISREALPAFVEAFEAVVARAGRGEVGVPLSLDATVTLGSIDLPLVDELVRLEPCGVGNPEPCLVSDPVTVERTRIVGGDHLQVTLRDGGAVRDGFAFRFAARDPGAGSKVAVAYVPEIDTWRGNRRLRLRLRDLRPIV
ncbi:MAG: single-stranded-DNA-specific exonuclease RecJ [Polyangia bacterium]